MPDFAIDTSSYPKPPLPTSPLDTVGKVQNLQIGNQVIQQNKLDQANQALTYLMRAMGSIGPNGTREQYENVGKTAVKNGLVPEEMLGEWISQIPKDQKEMPAFYDRIMTTAATHQEQVGYHLGHNTGIQNNQTYQPTVASPRFGERTVGPPIQMQVPPTAEAQDTDARSPTYGSRKYIGPQPATAAPGAAVAPPPVSNRLPIAPAPAVIKPAHGAFATPPATVKDEASVPTGTPTPGQPTGLATSMPPLFESGQKQLIADQSEAADRLFATKPMVQALRLMKNLSTGPGTAEWNKGVGALKAFGILPTGTAENDKTAIYEIVNKKLSMFVQGNGSRSDADLAKREDSNPNIKTQINPALVQLTKDAIMFNREIAARGLAFKEKDTSKYGAHRALFHGTVDTRGFGHDLMEIDEPGSGTKLFKEMEKKATSKDANDRSEAAKYFKALGHAHDIGAY